MPLSRKLIEAYRRADYVVFGERELVLRIGERSAGLDGLLEAGGARTAAFITASNPRGKQRGARENEIANAALVKSQSEAGFRCFEAEGRAPDRSWAEKSVLVAGISREGAAAVGRAFDQNAIVFLERGLAPELVLLED